MATKKESTTGLRKLLEDQLGDIYYAEKQLMKVLPRMARNATNKELQVAFQKHLHETHGQIERLEQVFGNIGLPPKGRTCPAILGLVQESNDLMDAFEDDVAMDAALIAGAQKVEHYEIATYSSLCALAERLGLDDAADLLQETLEEEQGADDKLSEIAEFVIGAWAMNDEDVDVDELMGMEGNSRPVSMSKSASNDSRTRAFSASNGSARMSFSPSLNGGSSSKH